MSRMWSSITVNRIREHRFPRPALYGTFAVLALAARCAAAPGAIAVPNMTSAAMGGFIYAGARMWVAGAARALCGSAPRALPDPNRTSAAMGRFIRGGARMWVADASRGLCRMDPSGGGGGGVTFQLTNCIVPSTSKLGVQAVVGQPAYDPATQFVYLPDMSAASKGIWRYAFNGQTFNSQGAVN